MNRAPIALLFTTLLAGSGSAAGTVAEQMAGLSQGSPVELRLRDKRRIRGRLGLLGPTDVAIQVARENAMETVRFSFVDIQSVKPIQKTSGATAGWIALGVLGGVVTVAALILVSISR